MNMLALDTGAPPPLAPLTHTIIGPENIAAEQRQKRAMTLSLFRRWKLWRYLRALNQQLQQLNYQEVVRRANEIKPELLELISQYKADKENPEVKQKLAQIYHQYRSMVRLIRKYEPQAEQAKAIQAQIEEHHIAVRRNQIQARLERDQRKEAVIYEGIIIDRLNRLGFCHKYTDGKGKPRTDSIRFSHVKMTVDAIYFKIDATYQTMWKNYMSNVPDGVRLGDIVKPENLFELSIACQRQVTAIASEVAGVWLIVNRLESSDGLMNYVKYEDVMERYPNQYRDRIPICVGVGRNRTIQWINFADFPHWLIAGYTKAGKSNLANVILCTLISIYSPDEVRLVLIDLKGGLEFGDYAGIPHLLGNIIDSVGGIAETLATVEAIMEQRFRKLRGIARKIEDYRVHRPNEKMPRIFVMLDEGASVMGHGETTKEINARLQQITSKGRAVGIHVIFCTQRPDKEVVKGAIKTNFAFRVTGRMVTSADSVTILGNSTAKEIAPVEGRMVMQLGPDPEQIQTPHVRSETITNALAKAVQHPAPAPLDLPGSNRRVYQEWTVERIVELSIKHLDGNITWKAIYESADELTQAQARSLVEQIWNMEVIEFQSKNYVIQKLRGGARKLVEAMPAIASF